MGLAKEHTRTIIADGLRFLWVILGTSASPSSTPKNRVGAVMGFVIAALVALSGRAAAPSAARPNIIFILTDDLGYGDLGAFFQNQRQAAGNRTQPFHLTPSLDTLAAEGIRFTHHYCPAPVCAPSRASLLLGVHQGHANVRDNQFDKALEDNHTLGTVMRGAGYATAALGKWGLGGKPATQPPDWPAHPLNRGFDFYFGYMRHVDGHEHYPREGPHRGKKEVWDNRTEISAALDKCYTADLFTARAKKWIVDQHTAKPAQPFFMYLAYDTPHATCELPTQAYPAGGGLKGGLQWLGKPGAMINTASGTIDSWIHPDYASATWDHDTNPDTPEVAWPNVHKRYATSVRRIDDAVGDLLQLLKDLQLDGNTLIVFSSDNGPSIESYLPEQIQPTFFGSYGPFDGIKRDCWEGGLRVPTIVRWPSAAAPGRITALPCSSPDWMPTFAEAAGVPAPARSDGVSLMPTLTGTGTQRTPRVYIEYFEGGKTPKFTQFDPAHRDRLRRQMQALCIGEFVGVRYNIVRHSDPFEIYNAVTDPKEIHNLAALPEYTGLRQQFHDTALRVRRPSGATTRPYDAELVPSVAVTAVKPGVTWQAFAGPFPWVPQFDTMIPTSTGHADRPDPAVNPRATGLLFSGYLQIPTDGKYTFSLSTDSGALLRIHEATVIDADFAYKPGQELSESILLKSGLHPFRLYYTHRSAATPSLALQWSGPNIDKQPVPAVVLFTSAAAPN